MKTKNSEKSEKSGSVNQYQDLIQVLKKRFEKNMARHKGILWEKVEERLKKNFEKLKALDEMEITEGEPDVVGLDKKSGEYIFMDCSAESPKGRRSLCYDQKALDSRKEHKPKNSAMGMAEEMGVEVLTQEQYYELQKLGTFDAKTSSWVQTPSEIRKLGGAIFGDWRYGQVFIYHNGAESYYAARGFRALLKV